VVKRLLEEQLQLEEQEEEQAVIELVVSELAA
jgi:hypothetical protein